MIQIGTTINKKYDEFSQKAQSEIGIDNQIF